MFIIVLFRNGEHLSLPAGNDPAAIITEAHNAMNQRRAFKIGDGATFWGEEVRGVYLAKEATLPEEVQQSIFDVVFGKRR